MIIKTSWKTIPTLKKILELNKEKIESKVKNQIGERTASDDTRQRRSTLFKIGFNEVQVYTLIQALIKKVFANNSPF